MVYNFQAILQNHEFYLLHKTTPFSVLTQDFLLISTIFNFKNLATYAKTQILPTIKIIVLESIILYFIERYYLILF